MNDEGGGASRSTDPASGTSSATDVSLREYVATRLDSLDRILTAELDALRRETRAANVNSERAIEVAAHEAAERLAAHNGLIDQMRQQASHYATRESVDDRREAIDGRLSRLEGFQAKMVGGLAVVGAIGIANLVKIWTG